MAKNSNIMTELMQKYGVSSGSYGGGTERTVSQSFGVSGGASGGNDLMQNLMNKYFGEDAQPEHERKQKLVSDWQKRYDSATKGFSSYENKRNGGYTRDAGGGYAAEIDALIRDFDSIKDFAGSYGMAGAKRYLYYLQDIQEYISDTNAAMSQFQGEEEYNRYLRGQDGGSTDISSLEQEIQDLKSFIDQSEYDMTDTNQRKKASQDVDRLNDLEDRYTFARYQNMIAGLSDKDRKALEDSHGKDGSMAYGYLLQKGYSREDINAMYETLKREKTAELSDDALQSVYDWTGKNAGTAAAGFAGARAGNLAGAVTGTFQTINDTARHYLQGSPYHGTDPNAAGYLPSRMAGAADQAVSDAIEGENGGILRKGAAFVYRGAANAADNLARMAVSSAIGGPALGEGVNSAFSFTQGFQSTYREAQEKGGSPLQGLLVGSVDGGMEVFTESKTFERWMNLKDPELIGEGVYEWLKSAAIGIGNEITEEEASYIANTIADAVVMADKSESAEYIKAAVAEGKTPAQARWELVKKYAHEMAVTAADTAMSTILMEGATGAVANYQYKKTYGGSQQELVQEGLDSPEGTKSRDLAEQYQKKLDEGKSLSGAELQRLVNANEAQFAQEEAASSDQVSHEGGGAATALDSAAPEKGYSVSQNQERGTTEITFAQKPSKEVQAILKGNGFKWSKKGKMWYGSQSIEQADSIVQKAMGISDTAPAGAEPMDSAVMESKTDSSAPGSEAAGAVNDAVPDDKPFDVSWIAGKTLLNQEDGSTVETRITGIASNDRGKLMLNVAGQSKPVSADKISYADYGDAILYQTINDLDITPGAAKEFVAQANEMGDKKAEFVFEVKNMYTLGELGVPLVKAVKSGYADNISSVMQEFGWGLGRRVYDAQVQKSESSKRANAAAQKASASVSGQNVNGVQYDGLTVKRGSGGDVEIEGLTLNDQQSAAIRAAEMLAQIGVNIHVFQSQTDANGNPVGDNGSYSTRDGSIHIDLNAGNMGQGVMAYTLSHEFTHFMEQQSPAMFQRFTDSLFSELDTDIEAEIVSKAETLKQQRPEQYKGADNGKLMQDARSEVVAEACETMLTDTDAAQRIAHRIQKQDATLWEKVVQWFRDLGDRLHKAYKGLDPDSQIAKEAKKTIQQVDSLVQMWADMAVDSAENYRTAEAGTKNAAGSVKMQARNGEASRPYSYDALVSKPDMNVTVIDGNAPKSRADVVYAAKWNARQIGKYHKDSKSVSVHVKDIDTDVLLTTAGLRHGLDRRFDVNAPVTVKIGEILQNSIRINEMNPSKESASESYALIGAAAAKDGQLYVVRSVVNRYSNEISSVDVLYAVNSKSDANKKMNRAGDNPQGTRHDSRFLTGSTISISELLDYVNEYFPDILPEDVLKHYGHEARPAGKLGESALYSERGGMTGNHQEELAKTREKMTKDAQDERETMIRNYQENRGISLQNWRRTEVDVLRQAAENTAALDLSEKEQNSLGIFREKLEKLDSIQAKYEEIRGKEGMLSAGDLDAISRYQKQMEAIHNKLWEYSQYPILKSVSQKAREILREHYGAIPAGENAVRAAELPAKTNKINRVSKTAATAIEAGVTTDTVAEQIQQKAVEGEYSYFPITDESAKQRADETIRRKGWDDALTDWRVDMRKSAFPGKDMVTLGFQLYNNAVNAGDTKTALHILTDITNTVRNSAQVVQAVRILKQLSPDDRLYAIRRQLDSVQNDLNERYGEKAPQIDMNSALAENYRNAQGEEAIRAAEEALFRDIAAKLPNTFADKWNSWRYLSMLGNVRTHVRNVLGNVGFAPVRSIKDWIAYGMEAGVNAISPDGIARTKGKLFVHSEADRALYSAGLKDYDTAENLIGSANLKSGDALSKIEQMRPAFGGDKAIWRALSKVAEKNSDALSAEDMIFKKTTYASAFGGYLKANGITAEMLQTGKIADSVLDGARVYAFDEALKATYNDFNDFSNFVAKLGNLRSSENKAVKTAGLLVEGVLPFKRTPANIVARSVEYSPVGMLNGIKKCLFDVRKGKVTAAEAIDSMASGLTGTMLLGLGALLANMELVSGGDDEDEKQRQFDKLRGEQSYALKAFGKSYTIDWLAPEVIPMFIGVELYNRVNSSGGLRFKDILESVARVSNPLLEMSCLSSLNDLLDSISYSDNKLYSIFSQSAASYVLQALPTVFGQIERIGETEREQTYLSDDSQLPKDMQQTIAKVANKIPGVEYRQIPYIDAYGRRQETGGVGTRAFSNLVSPGYLGSDRSAPWDDELQRLYDLGYASVLPPTAAKKIGDKELTAEEYVQYATFTGQERYRLLGDVTKSGYYRNSSDADKEEIIKDLYSYVNAEGSKKMIPDREVAKWTEKGMEMEKIGVPFAEFLRMKNTAVNENGNFTKETCVAFIQKNFPASKRKAVWDIMKNPNWKDAW